MKAKTIKGNSPEEIEAQLEKSMAEGYKPTLAVIFISVKQDRKAVCEIIRNKGIEIIGATSSGEFINGHQSEGGAAVLLFDLNKKNFHILFESIGNGNLTDAATHMAREAMTKFNKPAFIICSTLLSASGQMIDGETLIRGIEKTAGPDVNIFGGMAGDDISFTGTHVFTHDQTTDYGMVALILNEENISLTGMALSGWKPVGVFRTVTKSEGNLIYTIDNEPALEIYLRFLGEDKSSADDQVHFFDLIGVHYPFQIEREGRAPKMCNPIGYDKEKKALMCESDVPEGSKFRFSTPPDFDIIETVVEKAKDLKNQTQAEAEALLVFSCASRLSALGPMAQMENEGLSEIWKVPMAGFYTYGEFGRAINGKHEFHSTTNSWVALKEK